ncbi:sucrase ferredoxin [Nocardia terpenica]|uniref:sucrase ferredoxin n=1 Tax=Nocardia terpenica TaxID=455432 RepID=UPI001E47B4A7|nr:sucrase ferredoxin [Nocardia terpenica]
MTVFEGMSCSAAAADIPLPGSATRVTGWLCVEQPGAWGRDVLGDEVLGADITAELAARTKAARVRPTLIRRPGRNEFTGARTVLLAATRPRGSWCERLEIADLKELLDLDLHLLNGPAPGLGAPVTDPTILVCAHGKRDQCCALLGRPIAARLSAEYPDRVWECSHTGGHRFAPAMVILPTGLTYGRLSPDAALRVASDAHRNLIPLTGFRGRSCYTPVGQVAEIAVRQHLSSYGEPSACRSDDDQLDVDALTVAAVGDALPDTAAASSDTASASYAGAATVAHRDGRRWLVTARTIAYAPRQASCGAAPKPATAVVADELRPLF